MKYLPLTREQRDLLERLRAQSAREGTCQNCSHRRATFLEGIHYCAHLDRQVTTRNLCLDFTDRKEQP